MQAQGVRALHQVPVGVLAALEGQANIFSQAVTDSAVVTPFEGIALQFDDLAVPAGQVAADAPGQGAYLGFLDRGEYRGEKGLGGLRDFVPGVQIAVPVVDDLVAGWLRHVASG